MLPSLLRSVLTLPGDDVGDVSGKRARWTLGSLVATVWGRRCQTLVGG